MNKTLIFIILVISLISCHKNKIDENTFWNYSGNGDGNIDSTKNAIINYTINSNLNISGDVFLEENTIINNDLNLNRSGKVIVFTSRNTDTVYVDGNSNIDDSLFIERGILKINHDLNINSKGFVNCSKSAKVIVIGSLNQSGTLWGLNNFEIHKNTKLNNKNSTHALPF